MDSGQLERISRLVSRGELWTEIPCFHIPINERIEEGLLLANKLAEIKYQLETMTTSITMNRRSKNEIICTFDVYSD
jgi:hypothetical protein